jgi:spore maturation protein CgeB
MPGLSSYRHPKEIRAIRAGPLYGRDLYAALAGTKVVLNGAIDMAGVDRGNMRCFEATGCGAVLLTDSGIYPDGFIDNETMVTYSSPAEIPGLVNRLIADVSWASSIAKQGRAMVRDRYSKARQWAKFREFV